MIIIDNKTTTADELLQELQELQNCDTLDLQCIRQQLEMIKRRNIIEKHPYKPTYNEKKKRWFTRFEKDGKLIQRNRKTKEEIEDCIYEFYTNPQDDEPKEDLYTTFSQAHDMWIEAQKEYGKSNNSIRRYETDWTRFFSGTKFEKMDVTKITAKDIEIFMIENIKKYNLKRRGGDGLYACISGVFYNLAMEKVINLADNPCNLVDKKRFNKFYNTDEKTIEERTISQSDLLKLIQQISMDIERRPNYIYPYGVQLALLTGMRVGEIAGLRWSHVYNDYIKVCESEKYDVLERRYYQSKTKTGKIRSVPITSHLREFLNKMADLQQQYGITEDFVLSFGDGKIRCKNLTAYMNHKCEQLCFDSNKSIHAIRRTFNSYLRFDGLTAVEAGSLIGNTPKVNDAHYTYDIQDIDKKKKFMENAEQRMVVHPLVS